MTHTNSSAFVWCVKPKSINFSNTELQNEPDQPTVCRSLLSVQPTLWFCCQANSKAPKVGQVFLYAACSNHSRLLFSLRTDPLWSWCYNLEKFNCRGWCVVLSAWCVVLSAVHKVVGWPKFSQLSEWLNFPQATLYAHTNNQALTDWVLSAPPAFNVLD